jgi:hypothetical protein
MSHKSNTFEPEGSKRSNSATVHHLAQMWAKKYVQSVNAYSDVFPLTSIGFAHEEARRTHTVKKLQQSLRTASIKAWTQTEKLIAREIRRHQIDDQLIDPWQISEDSFRVYQKTIDIYAEQGSPQHLARVLGSTVGRIRYKYTSQDPRVIGFVALQFHYTGQMLLKEISEWERERVNSYLKVIDDYLYMPLQRAYEAAAEHDFDSTALLVVQQLLPLSSEIARNVCERVIELYPNYCTYSGSLKDSVVKIASIRDAEMFQVYLWVCVLEQSIGAIQQELFPLCLMLYPSLRVKWELVRQMVHLLGQEIHSRLGAKQQKIFLPYCQVLWEMFSPEIFPESLDDI